MHMAEGGCGESVRDTVEIGTLDFCLRNFAMAMEVSAEAPSKTEAKAQPIWELMSEHIWSIIGRVMPR